MNLIAYDLSFSDISHSAMWIVILLLCYGLAMRLAKWTNQHILAHPILITTTLMLTLTQLIEPDVALVMTHLHPIKYLLGPLTVGLALPVYNQLSVLRELGIKVIIPIAVGGLFAPLSAFSVLYLLDAEPAWQLTILTKSITTPFAMDTASMLGELQGLQQYLTLLLV
jgi:putative effector of murein hydrolase